MHQDRVHEVLKKMNTNPIHIDNDGSHLANFKPLSHPLVEKQTPESIPSFPPLFQYMTPPSSNYPVYSSPDLDKNGSHYHQVYEVPKTVNSWSKQPTNSPNHQIHHDKLLDKINYMIHLLEQQQNEKTNNSLEEFVMFSFIGIFIIYVLDSFTRSAKYTR